MNGPADLRERTDQDAGATERRSERRAAPTRRGRAIWVIVAALTAFVVVVPLGVQIWGRMIRRTETTRTAYREHPVTTLEVAAGSASVSVESGSAGQVTIEQTLKWALNKPHVERSWKDGTLRLTVVCGSGKRLFSSLECGVDLIVRVPPGVALRATSTSGTVGALGLTGPLRLQTSSGVVSVERVTGPIWARSDSGVITGSGVRSREVDARSSSGAIGLAFGEPPQSVRATSSSGAVTLTLPPGSRYQVRGTSSSGDRQIDPTLKDDTASRLVDVTTSSGAVTIGHGSD